MPDRCSADKGSGHAPVRRWRRLTDSAPAKWVRQAQRGIKHSRARGNDCPANEGAVAVNPFYAEDKRGHDERRLLREHRQHEEDQRGREIKYRLAIKSGLVMFFTFTGPRVAPV